MISFILQTPKSHNLQIYLEEISSHLISILLHLPRRGAGALFQPLHIRIVLCRPRRDNAAEVAHGQRQREIHRLHQAADHGPPAAQADNEAGGATADG